MDPKCARTVEKNLRFVFCPLQTLKYHCEYIKSKCAQKASQGTQTFYLPAMFKEIEVQLKYYLVIDRIYIIERSGTSLSTL